MFLLDLVLSQTASWKPAPFCLKTHKNKTISEDNLHCVNRTEPSSFLFISTQKHQLGLHHLISLGKERCNKQNNFIFKRTRREQNSQKIRSRVRSFFSAHFLPTSPYFLLNPGALVCSLPTWKMERKRLLYKSYSKNNVFPLLTKHFE